ncbi:unnamed protein product [Cochlearia groenlandica]
MVGDCSIRHVSAPPFLPPPTRTLFIFDLASFPPLPFSLSLPNSQSRFTFTASKSTFSPRSVVLLTSLATTVPVETLAPAQTQKTTVEVPAPAHTQTQKPSPSANAESVMNTTTEEASQPTSTPNINTSSENPAPNSSWLDELKLLQTGL